MCAPITDGKVEIIWEHGKPYGIRDRSGYLFFFTKAERYQGQEDRYKRDAAQKTALAEFLLKALTHP